MCVCVTIYYINRTFNRKTNVLKKKIYMCDQRTEKSNINIYSALKWKQLLPYRVSLLSIVFSSTMKRSATCFLYTHFDSLRDQNLLYLAEKKFKFFPLTCIFLAVKKMKIRKQFSRWSFFHLWMCIHHSYTIARAHVCVGARMIQRAKKKKNS